MIKALSSNKAINRTNKTLLLSSQCMFACYGKRQAYMMISVSDAANSYLLAAHRCEEQRPINQNQSQFLLVPAVTNRAFSVELFLKAISELDNTPLKGHDLRKLFEKLKQERKDQIIKATGLEVHIFLAELEKNAKLFIEWRYLFEKDDILVSWRFLQTLSIAIKNVFEKC